MKNNKVIPLGLYGITDSKSGADKNLLTYSEDLLKAGIKILQYREKKKNMRTKLEEAFALRKLTFKYNALFIVNDDIPIALAVKADGIHIGQEDLPIQEVRKIVGKEMIIGVSTHSPSQAEKAVEEGADYIGVGPIFSTNTKEDVVDPVGFEYLEYVQKNITLPYVAIGGIKVHNIQEILKRKASRIALVSELVGAEDTYETTKKVLAMF